MTEKTQCPRCREIDEGKKNVARKAAGVQRVIEEVLGKDALREISKKSRKNTSRSVGVR